MEVSSTTLFLPFNSNILEVLLIVEEDPAFSCWLTTLDDGGVVLSFFLFFSWGSLLFIGPC
jgi:hypothetical protein